MANEKDNRQLTLHEMIANDAEKLRDLSLGYNPDELDEGQIRRLRLDSRIINLPAVRAAKKANLASRVHRRLITPIDDEADNKSRLSFQHTVFCQTGLPYRNPGDDVRLWQREQGAVKLRIEAGSAVHPKTGQWVDLGLPWGTKPRLILAHLNTVALQQNSPVIEVEGSLSAFVKRIRGFQHGREIRAFKDQLSRLSVALVRLATTRSGQGFQIDTKVIGGFALWPELDERQRVLWPAVIRLSEDYFQSLREHAVPVNEGDLAVLAHSALALDIYCWLAQRLHRVDPLRPVFIQWPSVKAQFGADYGRLNNFKAEFLIALRQVLTRYQRARVEVEEGGLRLHASLPPVNKLLG
jgi:Plasmid encoded RepA protein